jgi:hypothetical protein
MSTALTPEMLCPACGGTSVSGYVHFGSYGVQCFACFWQGPTTSWLAVASRIPRRVRAAVVDETGTAIRPVAEGAGEEIQEAVARVAAEGNVVRLFTEHTDA